MGKQKEQLLGVQYLRAIAALMVAYFHLTMWTPAYAQYLASAGWIGTWYFQGAVPVFFVISGFVMYISAIESRPGRFILRRIARIVPLYWAMTLIFVVFGLKHGVDLPFSHIAKSLLFVPYWKHPGDHIAYPILSPGWSLNYEIFFYGIFTLVLFIAPARRLASLLIALAALVCVGLIFPVMEVDPVTATYTSRLLLLFGAGVLLGWAYRKSALRPRPALAILLLVLGFIALVATPTLEIVRDEVAPVAIVLGAVCLDLTGATPHWKFMKQLGDASYSIYLVHYLAFDLVWKYWIRLHAQGRVAAVEFALVSITTAIGLALLTYRLIEKPAYRFAMPQTGPSAVSA